jgi:hypothetical protein
VLLAGCGRVGFDARDGGLVVDTLDGPAATNCFDRWRGGVPPLTMPQLIVDDGASEHDPMLSPDGLRLYYTTDRDGPYRTYYTERPSLAGNFFERGLATDLPDVPRANFVFLDDETIYSTDLAATDNYDITLYARTGTTSPFTAFSDPGISVLNSAASDLDVYVSPDTLSLYFARYVGTNDFDIYRSSRPTSSVAWATPSPIPALAATGVAELDPYVTPDGLTMLYSALSPAPQREYVTTRASTSDEFAPGTPIDLGGNTSSNHDGVLSPNGCELYFSSTRIDGSDSVFFATVLPKP